jgi:hypothetical protein
MLLDRIANDAAGNSGTMQHTKSKREALKRHHRRALEKAPSHGQLLPPTNSELVSSNDPLEQMKRSIPGCDGVVRLVIFGSFHSIRYNRGHDPAETTPKYHAFYFLLYLLSHFQTRGRHIVEFGATHLP